MTPNMSRRTVLGMAGAGVALAGAGAAAGIAATSGPHGSPFGPVADAVEFFGDHQAGITTPSQDRMHFVALDVVDGDRARLAGLLRRWSAAAERLTAGAELTGRGAVGGNPDS